MKQILRHFIVLLWLLLVASPSAWALVDDFNRIGVDDGLPNATIYGIAQDSDGFIWLSSTNSGLLRYDGHQFDEFPVLTAPELEQQGSKDVGTVLIDKHHHIWAGTWGYGLSRLDAKDGTLTRYQADPNSANGLASAQIQTLFEDHLGRIWVGSTGGLNRIDPDLQIRRIVDKQSAVGSVRIWSIQQSADQTIWFATSAGIHAYTDEGGLSKAYSPFSSDNGRTNEIRALLAVGNKLWVGTRQGLFIFDCQTKTFESVAFFNGATPPIINVLSLEETGMLLVGTYNGLYRVHPQLKRFIRFREQSSLFATVNIRAIFTDRTGVLWLGSRENGLFYTRHAKSAFSSLQELLPQPQANELNFSVTAVLADAKNIWLGSVDKLYRFDRVTKKLSSYATNGRVNSIKTTPDGQVFVATDVGLYKTDGGLLLLDKSATKTVAQGSANVRDLAVDDDGSLWLGLWGDGVLHFNRETGETEQYLQQQMRTKVGEAVQALLLTPEHVWVGTRYSGIYQIARATGVVTAFNRQQSEGPQLPSDDIQCIEAGPDNTILICTPLGLVIYDANLHQSALLNQAHGLPNSNVFGAYSDQQQNLWLMSSRGLSYRPRGQDRIITFTHQDGLVATELVFKSIFDDQQGTLYVGTIDGLTLVEPALVWVNQVEPKVAVSRVLINNRPLPLKAHTSQWQNLTLGPNDTSIEFEFASMDFHDVSRNQYMYRLVGFDDDWIRQPGRRSAYYSNLPPGDYQLQLRGSNNHGLFNAEPLQLQLRVLPHWWQYRSVQGLGALIVLLFIVIVHQYRLRHVQQINRLLQASVEERAKAQLVLETKVAERTRALEESSLTLSLRSRQLEKSLTEVAKANQELKRLDHLKDEFISTVSHELRTPLTSIRGAIGLVAKQAVPYGSDAYQQLIETAQQNSDRLSTLINDLLDVQKFEAGQFELHFKQVDLVALCTDALQAISSYAPKYQVTVLFVNNVVGQALCQGDALRIRQVLDNLLSNAVKFSNPHSDVTLRISAELDSWLVEVQDQGKGIPEQFKARIFEKFSQADASDTRSREGTGLGLTICKRIIEAHHGEIGFRSEEQVGSTFYFRLNREDSV